MIALLGVGAHGRDILAHFRFAATFKGYDDDPQKGYPPTSEATDPCVVGVNDPAGRQALAAGHRAARPLVNWRPATDFALGCVVHPSVQLGDHVVAGEHTHINYCASMTRTMLGAFVTISPGVTICGDVVIGDATLVGAGATICDRVRIGKGCRIGAGAVVLPDTEVRDGETWVGVPAAPIEIPFNPLPARPRAAVMPKQRP